ARCKGGCREPEPGQVDRRKSSQDGQGRRQDSLRTTADRRVAMPGSHAGAAGQGTARVVGGAPTTGLSAYEALQRSPRHASSNGRVPGGTGTFEQGRLAAI